MIFEAPGALWSSWATRPPGAKMTQDASWEASWASFGGLVGRILQPSWRQDGAKLANLVPRCAQDGLLGPEMGNLACFWEHLGDFFG